MEEITKKFEYLFGATEETRTEFMGDFLYFMKLVDMCPPQEMIKDFELFCKVATFVHSEDYTRVYHSHDLKRNLQKRVVATPIVKVLKELTDEVTWKMLSQMNYMIKVSDEALTVLRKFEIAQALQQTEQLLRQKFATEFAENPYDVDFIEIYLKMDLEELQKKVDETKPKVKAPEEVKPPPPKKTEKEENEVELTEEELEKYGLIPEFKSRSKLLRFFRKKNVRRLGEYLKGVKCIVESINTHGYDVAKVFFLNPVE